MTSTKGIVNRFINDDLLPNHLRDTKYLLEHLNDESKEGYSDDLILLALGETWEKVPKKLTAYLNETSIEEHGYLLSMYGLPEFRKTLKDYISRDELWPDNNTLELAVNLSGTRGAMLDIGKYIKDEAKERHSNKTPYYICTDPGWDYEGVYKPLGFKGKLINLKPDNKFDIRLEDFESAVTEIKKDPNGYLALIILNPQHNPTGNNLEEAVIRGVVRVVNREKCGLLIDNAYYGSTSYQDKSSALKIIIEMWEEIESAGSSHLIFATRTLGKQFHCNGWGIGALIASPSTLSILVNDYRTVHSYNSFGFLQSAMNKWILSEKASEYLQENHNEQLVKQKYIQEFFSSQLEYPLSKFHIGKYSPYMLFEVPRKYKEKLNGVEKYIKDLFFETGVLLTDCWAKPRLEKLREDIHYVRMYTGVSEQKIILALNRMYEKGFKY